MRTQQLLLLLLALAGPSRAGDGEGLLVTPRTPERVELDWPAGPGRVLVERAAAVTSGDTATLGSWQLLAALPRQAGTFVDTGLVRGGARYRYRLRAEEAPAGGGEGLEVALPAAPPLPGVVAVACGSYHTLFLDGDGAVWGAGDDSWGCVAGPPPQGADAWRPRRIHGLPAIRAIGAAHQTSAAVDGAGAVWVWGKAPPDLGAGAIRAPVRARWGGAKARAVEVHDDGLLVLDDAGGVWLGGRQLELPGPAAAISATGTYALALGADGQVTSIFGALGVEPVVLPRPARKAAAGEHHGLAILDDGSLWSWGGDEGGQLGDPGRTSVDPAPVPGVVEASVVGAGHFSSFAADGARVRGWGTGPFDPWGRVAPRTAEQRAPVELAGDSSGSQVVAVRGGWFHAVVLRADGTVSALGGNMSGQLGTGRTGLLAPALVPDLDQVVVVAAGYLHTLALRRGGDLWGWGRSYDGQVGQGPGRSAHPTPVQVAAPAGMTLVVAGGHASLSVDEAGVPWGWGQGLGPGRAPPAPMDGLLGAVRALSAGPGGLVFVRRDGSVWARDGQDPLPRGIEGPTAARGVACGADFAVAIGGDGAVWSWGREGRPGGDTLGRGPQASPTAAKVTGLPTTAVQVACGRQFALALCDDGTVWAWGSGAVDQLGVPGTRRANRPVRVAGLEDVAAIVCGREHSLALLADGSVWAWGENGDGRIGDGTRARAPRPTRVPNLPAIRALGAGSAHSLAVDRAGRLWSWGCASSGRLGTGETSDEDALRPVVAPEPPG